MTSWGKGLILGAVIGFLPSVLFFCLLKEQEALTRQYYLKWRDGVLECRKI